MKKITLLIALISMCFMNAQVSTGTINFAAGYSGQIDVDDAGVTVTLIGPDDQWLGIGFGVSSMTSGEDIISFDDSGFQDRQFLGIGATPSIDPNQDWTVVTNTTAGGQRTLVVTRDLTGADANDFEFNPEDTSIQLVWALGNNTLTFGNHGSGNRNDTVVGFTLGILDQELAQNVQLYPNPAKREINIDLGAINFEDSSIKIYSVLGQLVTEETLNSKTNTIDTSSLPSGIYLMTITAEEASVTKRFIKQ